LECDTLEHLKESLRLVRETRVCIDRLRAVRRTYETHTLQSQEAIRSSRTMMFEAGDSWPTIPAFEAMKRRFGGP
jgi:hypothetical protein